MFDKKNGKNKLILEFQFFYKKGMKMKNKKSWRPFATAPVMITAILLLAVGCNTTPGVISAVERAKLCLQVRQRPYVAMFEGLQPFSGERMNILSQRLRESLHLATCATSGNHQEHMPIIREANRNHQPIYIAGFSMGEIDAIKLAEACDKEGIPVEKLFLIDGPQKGKIPANVKRAIDIVGIVPYTFRRMGRYLQSDLEGKDTNLRYFELNCEHLSIPANSYSFFIFELPSGR